MASGDGHDATGDGIWGTTTTTALDRLAMIRTVVQPNALLSDASRAYPVGLVEHVTPSQDWGATGGVPPGVTVALKNGFSVINGWRINPTGWVDGAGGDYLIAVVTDGNPSEQCGIETVDAVSDLVWPALASWARRHGALGRVTGILSSPALEHGRR